jgi:DNA-binding transcriptional LysR family regulator
MQCFVRAVETGSFSAVAREFVTGQPNVSRNIAALEQHLGTRLLHRSTRKLTMTPEGERYYAEVRLVLDALAVAESNARGEDKPSGLLKVSCPTSLGRTHLLPWTVKFIEQHPAVEVDVQISDRFVDMVEEGIDLAIRIGTLKDSNLRARRIGASERVCVASTGYLEGKPAPKVPADLANHNCIGYTLFSAGASWLFSDGEAVIKGSLKSNTLDGVYQAVIDGLGIGYGPLWMFEAAVRSGDVKLLLTDFSPQPVPIQIVYSANRLMPRRASAFMDFFAEAFKAKPSLNEGALRNLLESQGRGARFTA